CRNLSARANCCRKFVSTYLNRFVALRMSAFGGKRTWRGLVSMSAFDPKRTLPNLDLTHFQAASLTRYDATPRPWRGNEAARVHLASCRPRAAAVRGAGAMPG